MQTQTLMFRHESSENINSVDMKLRLIPYDPQKEEEEELRQLEELEKQVLTISQIMEEFGCAIELQGENLDKIDTKVIEAIEHIDQSNDEMKDAIGIKTEIISTKLTIATVAIIGINTPIGLMLGTKILIGTLLASGVATVAWMYKT